MLIPSEFLNITTLIDCVDGIALLPNESIDFCLTDPPYNIGLKYEGYNDTMKEADFWSWIQGICSGLYRVLKPKAHLTFTCAQKHIWVYRPMLEEMGFTFRHLGIWHNPRRKAGSWPGMWPFAWEAVMDFTRGERYRKLNNKNCVGFMDVWVEVPPTGIKHPAKRPVEMWKELVRLCSDPDEIVLDPFMGSGTTAEAAITQSRNFIGFEIIGCYVDDSNKRAENVSID